MVKLIIFDWDDVFTLGSTEGYYKCYHEALVGVGVNMDAAEESRRIKARWGSGHVTQLRDLLRESPDLINHAIELYEQHFFGDTFVNCLTVVPGSQELLQRLSHIYKLAVATGAHPAVLRERILTKFNFPNVFAQILTIYDIDDITHAKPHPHMLDKILNDLKVMPSEAVMVGDARSDVEMAKAAGIEPIVVLTGHLNNREAGRLGVKHIIQDINGLEAELEGIK